MSIQSPPTRIDHIRSDADAVKRLVPWRCPSCGSMLARIALEPGSVIEIKCARCNAVAIKEAA